jgi:hypothetical protein
MPTQIPKYLPLLPRIPIPLPSGIPPHIRYIRRILGHHIGLPLLLPPNNRNQTRKPILPLKEPHPIAVIPRPNPELRVPHILLQALHELVRACDVDGVVPVVVGLHSVEDYVYGILEDFVAFCRAEERGV